MSTPLSKKWVAKQWRGTWTLTRLSRPAARQPAWSSTGSSAEQRPGQHHVALLSPLPRSLRIVTGRLSMSRTFGAATSATRGPTA
jgi:hypothetical protein